MKRYKKTLLSLLLAAALLLTAALPALAAGASNDPNVYLNRGGYVSDDGSFVDTDTVVTFDPASGRLTVDDRGNVVPICDEAAFLDWIRSVAPGVKTVYLPKTSELANFSLDEEGDAYASRVFWKAFSYLTNLERFEVEKGSRFFEAKDGVLYTPHCFDLVHYPAAKPDKTYGIDKWCLLSIYPYAFCNTRFLERVSFPYSRAAGVNFLMVEAYAFSAMDPATGEAVPSSIKAFDFYGSKEEFDSFISLYEGNDAAKNAEVNCLGTDWLHDLLTYVRVNYFVYFLLQLSWMRYMFPGN